MKWIFTITLFSIFSTSVLSQTCSSLFTYGTSFETVNFINQSTVNNAHYWWNFGDGTGSNSENPEHTYPETGTYMVTLFAKDTLTNCSDFHEVWLDATMFSTDSCISAITDSLYSNNGVNYLKIIELSSGCNGYSSNIDGVGTLNFSVANPIAINTSTPARYLSRIQYYSYDTINGSELKREAYKSIPYNYTSSINYDDCSANFEFKAIQEDSGGQRIFFTTMNDNALSYDWTLSGFGAPIHHSNDTMSHYFPFSHNDMWNVGLRIEGIGGCRDTLLQQILVRPTESSVLSIGNRNINVPNNKVFPNPFTRQTTLEFDYSANNEYVLTITNVTGEIVNRTSNILSGVVIINRGQLSSGMYFYRLCSGNNQVAAGKILIK